MPTTPSIARRLSALLVVVAPAIAACADDSGGPGLGRPLPSSNAVIVTTTVTPTTTPAVAPTTTPTVVVPTAPPEPDGTIPAETAANTTAPTTTLSAPRVGDPRVERELVVEIDRPVDLAVRPGDDALHLVSQRGRVIRYDPATGEQRTTLDVTGLISGGENEQGLLGLAFSPDGTLAYVDYTDADGDTVIAEYRVDASGDLDDTSRRIVLTVDQPYGNHNAGDLAFGPDGMLYVTLGDGGSGGDPERRASDPTQLLGSLLRIDPRPTGDAAYTVPADNPFAGGSFDGVAGAPEVWSWGLRNPWKIAFDPANGDLWIADVGQNQHEEVNRVTTGDHPAGYGADFGWSAFEGTERYNDDVADTGRTTSPVLTYSHDDGCSVSGGVPYRGTAIVDLEPAYLYSDYCSGVLWALDLDGGRNLVLLDGFDQVTAVRAGPDGEVYVLQAGGAVERIVPA